MAVTDRGWIPGTVSADRHDEIDPEIEKQGEAPAKLPGLNLFYGKAFATYPHDLDRAKTLEEQLTTGNNRWNVHQRLVKYAELTKLLFRCLKRQRETIEAYKAAYDQIMGNPGERARKRWTALEDEALVEEACRDSTTLVELALVFNRTPAAITSRLTYLVGVSRVNKAVAGRLIGYLDGEPVDGFFEGRLNRAQL